MFGYQPLVVYLCVSEYICCTSMSGTILPTMCQLFSMSGTIKQCVNFWW